MLEKTAASGSLHLDGGLPSALPTRVITYAWGEKYVGELLSMTLPALLAPGNLPYVASVLPCEVVILTQEAFFSRVLADPAVAGIRELCPVRLIGLDDLISVPDKYGMALTYVLHRGFADLGPAVTDHWLLFLNADFVLADGSLRNLVRHLAEGKRLVASPSYCVNAEAVIPLLLKRVDPQRRTLTLSPREMAALVLRHRHNMIRGKTVNQAFFSVTYVDQFYWRIDSNTLLGHQMPIAIVGMRPERYLAEPNSYWDHGLMKEFFPTAAPFVIGDSDEFLMLELRAENVARDQIRIGWPKASEIVHNFTSFLTPYQKEMAYHPLTLHAADLPAGVDAARAKLRAFVDDIFTHLPAELPSHINHPQWNYHLPGFIETRHKYLSARLGAATAQSEPPATLTDLDRVWWKLDGLSKSHARGQEDVGTAMRQPGDSEAAPTTTPVEQPPQFFRSELHARRVHEPSAMRMNEAIPGSVAHGSLPAASGASAPPGARDHSRRLPAADDSAQESGPEGLFAEADELKFEAARGRLQSDYDRLMKARVGSATIPVVVVGHGPQTRPIPYDNLLIRFGRGVYNRCFGRLPRVTPLHPYWAAMRHLMRVVDAAVRDGAADVLVIAAEGGGVADGAADGLPGLHARVSLPEAMQGSLAGAFDRSPRFDLCICTLGRGELHQFADLVKVVAPCMRGGGKVVGFHPNFALDPLSDTELQPLQGLLDARSPGRIHYAGSARSARVVQRYHRALSAVHGDRFANLARIATLLFLIAPRAWTANRREARALEEQSSRPPAHCTSITIDVTVPGSHGG